MRITYIGHATLLIEIGGVRFLTDPNFDPRLGRFLDRVQPPGIAIADLPPIDAVLLSHAHADHLSFDSLRQLSWTVPILAPAAVARWLSREGYRAAEAIRPGEHLSFGAVHVHAGAASHYGSRYAVDRWRRAANMYLLCNESESCFFAGDTSIREESTHLVEDHLRQQQRLLDVALLPIGFGPWWRPGFRRGHLTSQDALTLFDRLGARYLVPYHWGTFNHLTSGAYDAIREFRQLLPFFQRNHAVRVLNPGMTLDVSLEE